MQQTKPIAFAITKFLSNRRCLASVVSSIRSIDVTFVQTNWTARICAKHSIEIICGTLPFEAETCAQSDVATDLTEYEQIRWTGQNQTELFLSSPLESFGLPLFLTTGKADVTKRYRIKFRLLTTCWGAIPDFQAEQKFWMKHYQARIAAGNIFFEERINDLNRQKEVANLARIGPGDFIPVTMGARKDTQKSGILLISDSNSVGIFGGLLCVLGDLGESPNKIERLVEWTENGIENSILADIAEIIDLEPIP